MSQATINDHVYNISRLSVFEQLRLARKLSLFLGLMAQAENYAEKTDHDWCEAFLAITASMPEADIAQAINVCLSVVTRQSGATWAKVQEQQSGKLMFEADTGMGELLVLVRRVVDEHGLLDHFGTPRSASEGPTQA